MIGSSKNSTENYPRKCFRTQEKETQVKFNPGLSAEIGLRTTGPCKSPVSVTWWTIKWPTSLTNCFHSVCFIWCKSCDNFTFTVTTNWLKSCRHVEQHYTLNLPSGNDNKFVCLQNIILYWRKTQGRRGWRPSLSRLSPTLKQNTALLAGPPRQLIYNCPIRECRVLISPWVRKKAI